MKVSKRERTLLIIVLMLALVCAYYLLFLKPYLTEISDLNIELANSETQVQTYTQLKVNVDNIDNQIEEKRNEIDEFSHDINTGFDQPPVLVYLEETVGYHGEKHMFVFGTSEQVGQMIISPVKITMVTTYDELKGFISDVSEGEYIIKVTSIQASVTSPIEEGNVEAETTETAEGETASGETTDGEASSNLYVPVTTSSGEKTEGMKIVEESETLLKVSIDLEIYGMYGDIPQGKVYDFGEGSYSYGGDIFY